MILCLMRSRKLSSTSSSSCLCWLSSSLLLVLRSRMFSGKISFRLAATLSRYSRTCSFFPLRSNHGNDSESQKKEMRKLSVWLFHHVDVITQLRQFLAFVLALPGNWQTCLIAQWLKRSKAGALSLYYQWWKQSSWRSDESIWKISTMTTTS